MGGVSPYHPHTEMLDLNTKTWSTRASYPYTDDISNAPILFHKSFFIIFGGYKRDSSKSDIIAKYTPATNQWTKLGILRRLRSHHDAVEAPGFFLIVGAGNGKNYETERCILEGDNMTCAIQPPDLGR